MPASPMRIRFHSDAMNKNPPAFPGEPGRFGTSTEIIAAFGGPPAAYKAVYTSIHACSVVHISGKARQG